MKRDELESRVDRHRDELDRVEKVPVDQIWDKVQGHLPVPDQTRDNPWKIGRNWQLLLAAASFALLVSISLWVLRAEPEPSFRLANAFPELAAQEEAYLRQIAEREDELGLDKIDQATFEDVFRELEELEEVQKTARKDLDSEPSKEELVALLMRYYERRLMVLDRLQKELDRQKMQKQRDENLEI